MSCRLIFVMLHSGDLVVYYLGIEGCVHRNIWVTNWLLSIFFCKLVVGTWDYFLFVGYIFLVKLGR